MIAIRQYRENVRVDKITSRDDALARLILAADNLLREADWATAENHKPRNFILVLQTLVEDKDATFFELEQR